MSGFHNTALIGASGQGGGYTIENSLRLRSSASAYLNRTPATAGNRKTWTYSAWVKRGTLSVNNQYLLGTPFNGATGFRFNSNDTFLFTGNGATQFNFNTTQVFRDSSAWYHIVIAFDTTQATSSNRVKFYVNGVQITAFSIATYPSLNLDGQINAADVHRISHVNNDAGTNFDGYLAEVNFIDGQALTPSDFGEYNADTGVWQPVAYAGTYGTNGFYLPFSDATNTTTLAADASGNGNDWTPNNISLTSGATYDSMTDTPTPYADGGNYAVLNPLSNLIGGNYPTMSNGNLSAAGAGIPTHVWGTFGIAAGDTTSWYWESVCTSLDASRTYIGIIDSTTTSSAPGASYAFVDKAILSRTGAYYNTASGTAGSSAGTYTSYAVNDVVMIAYQNGKIWFGKNGTWMNSGNPAAGTGAIDTAVSTARTWIPYFGYNSSWTANFGQRPFAYTPPTGFLPLHTGNLPDSAIVDGSQYFAIDTYSGTGATNARTIGFQPDFVWIKSRTNAYWYKLFDSIRGANKPLVSNATSIELTETTGLMSFDSDGFTLGTSADSTVNNSGSGQTYVAWNWKANGAGVSNDEGSITSTVSANPTSGFSIVTWTGTGANATVGHGLGVAPRMMILMNRDTTHDNIVWHAAFTATERIYLNLTNAKDTGAATSFNSILPSSSVISLGSNLYTNGSTNKMVAYCFAEVEGHSKLGSYTGNGSTNGPFVFTGFRPAFVMVKRTNAAQDWMMFDNTRNSYNATNLYLQPNNSTAEASGIGDGIDLLSNGFKARNSNPTINASGGNYIYMAFAENPFKNSLAR